MDALDDFLSSELERLQRENAAVAVGERDAAGDIAPRLVKTSTTNQEKEPVNALFTPPRPAPGHVLRAAHLQTPTSRTRKHATARPMATAPVDGLDSEILHAPLFGRGRRIAAPASAPAPAPTPAPAPAPAPEPEPAPSLLLFPPLDARRPAYTSAPTSPSMQSPLSRQTPFTETTPLKPTTPRRPTTPSIPSSIPSTWSSQASAHAGAAVPAPVQTPSSPEVKVEPATPVTSAPTALPALSVPPRTPALDRFHHIFAMMPPASSSPISASHSPWQGTRHAGPTRPAARDNSVISSFSGEWRENQLLATRLATAKKAAHGSEEVGHSWGGLTGGVKKRKFSWGEELRSDRLGGDDVHEDDGEEQEEDSDDGFEGRGHRRSKRRSR